MPLDKQPAVRWANTNPGFIRAEAYESGFNLVSKKVNKHNFPNVKENVFKPTTG